MRICPGFSCVRRGSKPLHTAANCSRDSPTWPYWHRANTELASSLRLVSTVASKSLTRHWSTRPPQEFTPSSYARIFHMLLLLTIAGSNQVPDCQVESETMRPPQRMHCSASRSPVHPVSVRPPTHLLELVQKAFVRSCWWTTIRRWRRCSPPRTLCSSRRTYRDSRVRVSDPSSASRSP